MLRNSEKPEDMRQAHQGLPGPERHGSLSSLALAYANLLEERIYILDLELSAMRDRFGHQLYWGPRDEHGRPIPEENLPDMGENPAPGSTDVVFREEPSPFDPAKMEAVFKGESPWFSTVHPWDVAPPPDHTNPLGQSARVLMEQMTNQMDAVRAKNTDLEIANREVQLQLDQVLHEREAYKEEVRRLTEHSNLLVNAMNGNVPKSEGEISLEGWTRNVARWCRETFGSVIYLDPRERAARLVEEAIEVGQAAGLLPGMVKAITDMVYSKPPGDMDQELGGVIVCWGVMAQALHKVPTQIMVNAAKDCWDRQTVIRAKLAGKIAAGTSPSTIDDLVDPLGHLKPKPEPKIMPQVIDEDAERAGPGPTRHIDSDTIISQAKANNQAYMDSVRQPDRGEG